MATSAGPRLCKVQPVHEQAAVRQAGEVVVKRLMSQLVLKSPLLGDVSSDRRHALDGAVGPPVGDEHLGHRELAAAGASPGEFASPEAFLTEHGQGLVEVASPGLGGQQIDHVDLADVAHLDTEEFAQGPVQVHRASFDPGDGHEVGGLIEDRLGGSELLHRLVQLAGDLLGDGLGLPTGGPLAPQAPLQSGGIRGEGSVHRRQDPVGVKAQRMMQ